MFDPQPLSRQGRGHDVRAARFRVNQDLDLLHDLFVGKPSTQPLFQDIRLRGDFNDLVWQESAFESANER